jgi:hypothetical protein
MNSVLLTGVILLAAMTLGWVLHNRSARDMRAILRRLAAEKNGTVESASLLFMPKLRFSYSGTQVEVSSASTGTSGNSKRYTYAVFSGLTSKGFEFRILPRSLQTMSAKWVGRKKTMSTQVDELDQRLVIYTNNEPVMEAVLSDRVRADLLSWAKQKENRISDIRNYDNKMIFAVTGTLKNHEEYELLLDTACRFYDAVTNVVSESRE